MTAKSSRKAGWKPGQSGNPAGRRKGAPNRATMALRERIEREADPIAFLIAVMRGEAVKRAPTPGAEAVDVLPTLDQSLAAARVLTGKIAPDAKDRPIRLDLGELKGPGDALAAIARVLAAMGAGEITPAEAGAVVSAVDSFRAVWEATELEKRITALEGKQP